MLRPSSAMFAAPAASSSALHRIEAGIELGDSRLGREEQRRGNQNQDAIGAAPEGGLTAV